MGTSRAVLLHDPTQNAIVNLTITPCNELSVLPGTIRIFDRTNKASHKNDAKFITRGLYASNPALKPALARTLRLCISESPDSHLDFPVLEDFIILGIP